MSQKKRITIAVIHGPNLNLLGNRERDIYGKTTLADINALIKKTAGELGIDATFFQSNHEGEIIDHIHACQNARGILINPGAFTHTSVAIRDALLAVAKPVVEVHLSNVHAREEFRRVSLVSDIAVGVVCGFGAESYRLGLYGLSALLQRGK